MSNARSILPDYDIFTAPGVQVLPGTITEAAAGTGLGKSRIFALSPVVAALKGLGEDAAPTVPGAVVSTGGKITAGDAAWAVAILGIAGALSYQAGKAMAPSRDKARTWGWIGVPVGLFGGLVGLGAMGFVANRSK